MLGRMNFWIAAGVLCCGVSMYAQDNLASKPAQAQTAPETAGGPRVSATTDPNYLIGAQDVLDISVWKEPDLSRAVPVRPDGKISLPLLNDVQAAGLTPAQLAAQITTGLNKYMTN